MSDKPSCQGFREALERSVEQGDVQAAADSPELREHLADCAACETELRVVVGLEAAGPESLSPEMGEAELEMKAHRLLAADAGARTRSRTPGWRLGFGLAGAATALAAMALAMWLFPETGPAPRKRPSQAPSVTETPRPAAPEEVARLVEVSGDVSDGSRALAVDARIAAGDELQTASGLARMIFRDGTVAVVDRDTRLKVTALSPDNRQLELAAGRATFGVSPLAAGQRLAVGIGRGEVAVHGTVFDVSVGGGGCRVRVAEGAVVFRPERGDEIALSAGQQLDCASGERGTLSDEEQTSLLRLVGRAPVAGTAEKPDAPRQVARATPTDKQSTTAGPRDSGTPAAAAPTPEPPPTLNELLERAGGWRARQHWPYVVATYKQLIALYPESPEARTCLVPMGKVQLERLGQPRAALGTFRSYLRADPRGSLAEEATWGSVVALRHLGRTDEELAALKRFLQAHPNSLYAPWAEERLRALEPVR